MGKTEKIILSPRQEQWLIRHFKHTKNDELASRLGISQSTLHRFARELGLKKSRQFTKKCQENTTRKAWEANRRNGWPPKGYRIPRSEEHGFKKGETSLQRIGAKREAERIAKAAESRRATVKKELARIHWGLEQKTKLKLVCNRKRIEYRHQLKKRGYLISEDGRVAVITPHTTRHLKYEEKAKREGMRITEQEL